MVKYIIFNFTQKCGLDSLLIYDFNLFGSVNIFLQMPYFTVKNEP